MNYLLAFAILVGWLIYGEGLLARAHDLAQGAAVWLDARYPNTERGPSR